jgi:prepilin-type N-terminal cleavage/methylation domain-containing protein
MAVFARTTTPHLLRDDGFTLIELMISVMLLMVVSGVVLQGMLGLGRVNDVVSNRTEMHAGVRNATELLQQEVGQAGRVSLPNPAALAGAVAAGAATVAVTSTDGMFVDQYLVVDIGATQETVQLTAVDAAADEITATFTQPHGNGAPVSVTGGFAAGVVPTTRANGSTATVLKIVGDVNGDGNMVYVEYTCDLNAGRLYRNALPYNAAVKPVPTTEQVLLDNVLPNPDGTPCFTYQQKVVNATTYVVGVAITLTVRTQDRDPITGQFQSETKALLNVSPRNVFNVWQMASLGYMNRVQELPPATELLLP